MFELKQSISYFLIFCRNDKIEKEREGDEIWKQKIMQKFAEDDKIGNDIIFYIILNKIVNFRFSLLN